MPHSYKPLSYFSDHYQEEFFVRDIYKLPYYQQNILLYEAEFLIEDLETYLDDQRDSEDLDWIKRISRKILITKKFAFYCRLCLKENVENKCAKRNAKKYEKRIKKYEEHIDKLEKFISSCFAAVSDWIYHSRDKNTMRLFFALGQSLKYNFSRKKQIEWFESYFENCKEEEVLKLASQVCSEYKYMNDPYCSHHLLPLISRAMTRQVKKLQSEALPCNDPDAPAT
jgi:hypothetical protein